MSPAQVATTITAVLSFAAAVIGLWNNRRIQGVNGKVDDVHALVDGTHGDLVARTVQLADSLTAAGVKVPHDNAVAPPAGPAGDGA